MLEYLVLRTAYTLLVALCATIQWDAMIAATTAMRVVKKKKPMGAMAMNTSISFGVLVVSLLPELLLATVLIKHSFIKKMKK